MAKPALILPFDTPPKFCQHCGAPLVAGWEQQAQAFNVLTGEPVQPPSIPTLICPNYSTALGSGDAWRHDNWWKPATQWNLRH